MSRKTDPIALAIKRDSREPKPCLICGAATHSRGIFVPKDSTRYGGNSRQQRLVIYPLCEDEQPDIETIEEVEQIIGRSMARS